MAQLGRYVPQEHADDFTDGNEDKSKSWLFGFGKRRALSIRILPPWDPNETNVQVPVFLHYGLIDKNDRFRMVQCPGRETCEACKYDSLHKNDPTYKAMRNFLRRQERHWMNVAILKEIPNPAFPNIATALAPRIWIWNCPTTVWRDLRAYMTVGTPTDLDQGANFLVVRNEVNNRTEYQVGYADKDPTTGGNILSALPPEFRQIIDTYPVIEDVNNDYGQTGSGVYDIKKALPPADATFIAEAIRRSVDRQMTQMAPAQPTGYSLPAGALPPPPAQRPPVMVPPPASRVPPPPMAVPAPMPVASQTRMPPPPLSGAPVARGPIYPASVPPPRGGTILPPPPPPPGVRLVPVTPPPPPAQAQPSFQTFDDFAAKGPDVL